MTSLYAKELLSVIAIVLTFIGYLVYYRDILRGRTRPHVYSWALWALLTFMIVAFQIEGGAGPAAIVTAAAGIMCFGVVLLSLRYGTKYITTLDTVVAILSLVAIGFWLLADAPVTSTLLVTLADMLAFFPTVRKSWNSPYTETLSLYVITAFRFFLALLAVQSYNILSSLWIVAWVLANGSFAILLIVRRQQLSSSGSTEVV